MQRDQAWQHLCDWTKTESLLKHARAVEIVMRKASHVYGEGEEEKWGLTGLLHDADYEQWPDQHPKMIVDWLLNQGEKEIAQAVAAHCVSSGSVVNSSLDKSLRACDELTGFVIACCLVRPEGISTLSSSSVRKKLKDKAFAAKVNRIEIAQATQELGVDPDSHVQLIIEALHPFSKELQIGPKET